SVDAMEDRQGDDNNQLIPATQEHQTEPGEDAMERTRRYVVKKMKMIATLDDFPAGLDDKDGWRPHHETPYVWYCRWRSNSALEWCLSRERHEGTVEKETASSRRKAARSRV
ncbi:MAG: hypothetical protein V3S20_09870, partial [Dehalococcoidia bacterium]